MALDLVYATGTAISITATETSLGVTGGTTVGVPVARTDAGVYTLYLDGVANMVKGDEYLLRVYEKARAAGVVRKLFALKLKGAQSEMIVIPNLILGAGWDITLQLISATARAFDWSVRRLS